jgi:hypothetical protein
MLVLSSKRGAKRSSHSEGIPMKIGQLVSVHGDLGRIAQIYKEEGKVAVRMRVNKDVWIVKESSIQKVEEA